MWDLTFFFNLASSSGDHVQEGSNLCLPSYVTASYISFQYAALWGFVKTWGSTDPKVSPVDGGSSSSKVGDLESKSELLPVNLFSKDMTFVTSSGCRMSRVGEMGGRIHGYVQ